jgi:hypothetical protein
MLFAIPAMTIVEHEMRRVTGSGTHAHEMFNAGSSADHGSRIQHLDDGGNREQVELRRNKSRDVVSGSTSKRRLAGRLGH